MDAGMEANAPGGGISREQKGGRVDELVHSLKRA